MLIICNVSVRGYDENYGNSKKQNRNIFLEKKKLLQIVKNINQKQTNQRGIREVVWLYVILYLGKL